MYLDAYRMRTGTGPGAIRLKEAEIPSTSFYGENSYDTLLSPRGDGGEVGWPKPRRSNAESVGEVREFKNMILRTTDRSRGIYYSGVTGSRYV